MTPVAGRARLSMEGLPTFADGASVTLRIGVAVDGWPVLSLGGRYTVFTAAGPLSLRSR